MSLYKRELLSLGIAAEFRTVVSAILAVSLVSALAEFFVFPPDESLRHILFFMILFFPPLVFYFYLDFLKSSRQRAIEDELPNALFQIASFPKRTSMEKMIDSVASSGYGPLSEEFAKARKLVASGTAVPEALDSVRRNNSSLLLNRAISLLIESYRSGTDLSFALKEVAEDVFELQALVKESSSALSLQKYTLLAASGILVPLILSLLLNTVSSLDFSLGAAEASSMVSSTPGRQALVASFVFSAQAYLVIFSAISSLFVALQEGNARRAVLYFAGLSPLALLVFNLVRTASVG